MLLIDYIHKNGGYAVFARACDVTRPTMSRVARGCQVPKPDLAVRIVCESRGAVTLDELYGVPEKWRKG